MRTSVISRAVPAFVAAIMVSSAAAYAAPMGGAPTGAPGMAEHHVTQIHMRGHDRHGGFGRQGVLGRTDHVEGRIAFLKAELKITDAQNTRWEAVAKAMRDQSAALSALRDEFRAAREEAAQKKDQPLTVPEVLARREQMADAHAKALAVRTEGRKQFATAFTALYDGLSADQKKVADGLFARAGRAHVMHHRR